MSTNNILSPDVADKVRKLHVDPDKLTWLSSNEVERMKQASAGREKNHKTGMAKSQKKQQVNTIIALALMAFAGVSLSIIAGWISNGNGPWGGGTFGVGNTAFVAITSLLFMLILLKRTARKKWYALVVLLYIGLYSFAPTDTAVIMFSQFIPVKLFMALPVPLFLLGVKLLVANAKDTRVTERLRMPRVLKNNRWSENEKKGQKVFGNAGTVGESAHIFGEDRASAGAEGERRTAYLLETLLDHIPGVTIYHGLRFPGSDNADIDHAVVIGDRIILVDAKMFRKGNYGLSRGADGDPKQPVIFGSSLGENTHFYKNHMDAASNSIRRLIPSVASVDVVIMIHSNQGLSNIISNKDFLTSPQMRLKNAHRGINYIGLEVARHAGEPVNEEIKRMMLSLLK